MKLKQTIAQILLACCAIGAPLTAQASFVNYYDVGHWQTSKTPSTSDASIDLTTAPNSITLISGNNAAEIGNVLSTIDFTIAAEATSTVSFDWEYATNDDSAEYDRFFFLHENDVYLLTEDNGSKQQAGHFEFSVLEGDMFGFRQHSFDSAFGSASTTISNFNTQAPVPAPGGLPLLAIALAGLKAFRRKRN